MTNSIVEAAVDDKGQFCRSVHSAAPKGPQMRQLHFVAEILIATPGILESFIKSWRLSLENVGFFVLNEADRMLDMGFEPQLQLVFRTIPYHRQTIMLSSTWTRKVRQLASQLVTVHAVYVFAGGVEEKLVANKAITQNVEVRNLHLLFPAASDA